MVKRTSSLLSPDCISSGPRVVRCYIFSSSWVWWLKWLLNATMLVAVRSGEKPPRRRIKDIALTTALSLLLYHHQHHHHYHRSKQVTAPAGHAAFASAMTTGALAWAIFPVTARNGCALSSLRGSTLPTKVGLFTSMPSALTAAFATASRETANVSLDMRARLVPGAHAPTTALAMVNAKTLRASLLWPTPSPLCGAKATFIPTSSLGP